MDMVNGWPEVVAGDKVSQRHGASERSITLELLLEQTIAALSSLDGEKSEDLAEAARSAVLPGSAEEWQRVLRHRTVLEYLLGSTGRQLMVLRRVGAPLTRFGTYSCNSGLV